MKLLSITNWDTSDSIMKWPYRNGLHIESAFIDAGRYGGGYAYKFCDGFINEKLSILITRYPSTLGKYIIRGKNVDGRYSNIYHVRYEQFKSVGHVRYVFNKIIEELC